MGAWEDRFSAPCVSPASLRADRPDASWRAGIDRQLLLVAKGADLKSGAKLFKAFRWATWAWQRIAGPTPGQGGGETRLRCHHHVRCLRVCRAVAPAYKGKLVFVTVDTDGPSKDPVMNFFGLKVCQRALCVLLGVQAAAGGPEAWN